MSYDPITTFAIYMFAILVIFTLAAVLADLWLAHDQRKARRQARDESRAKRMEERELSLETWH